MKEHHKTYQYFVLVVLNENEAKFGVTGKLLMSDDMRLLCKKILLIESIVLSSTKLNRTCKTNMIDVHKACQILVDHGLLSIESKMLANKSCYHEAYLKRIPQDNGNMIEFTLLLARFGIYNVDSYYETLKTGKLSVLSVDNIRDIK